MFDAPRAGGWSGFPGLSRCGGGGIRLGAGLSGSRLGAAQGQFNPPGGELLEFSKLCDLLTHHVHLFFPDIFRAAFPLVGVAELPEASFVAGDHSYQPGLRQGVAAATPYPGLLVRQSCCFALIKTQMLMRTQPALSTPAHRADRPARPQP